MMTTEEGTGQGYDVAGILRQFFATTREAMYISRRDGLILEHNAAFAALVGMEGRDLRGQEIGRWLDDGDDRAKFQEAVEASGVVHDYPIALKVRAGLPLLCLVDAVPWMDGGEVGGYHGIIRTKKGVMDGVMHYFTQLKEEKRQLKEARKAVVADSLLLSRYLGDEALEYIGRTGEDPLKSGQRRATILFFDIRHSTRIAEACEPHQFAQFVSDILTDIMDLVYGCKGSVNKLLGDGLMATFGCPLASPSHAYDAVDAAMKILDYLGTFNDVRPAFLREPVEGGIGIATGTVFAGIIGSVRRQEYGVLGDAVNTASRLEALTKSRPERILLDQETWQGVRDSIPCEPVFKAKLRGKEEPQVVFSPGGRR